LTPSSAEPSTFAVTDHRDLPLRASPLVPSLHGPVHHPAADHLDALGGGHGEPGKRETWAYGGGGGGRAGSCGKTDRAARLLVAAILPAVQLPSRVDGETLRIFWMLLRGQDVFLPGPPGCGKTYLVSKVMEGFWDAEVAVAACESSGVATALVGGTTVRSWAGFCFGDADVWSPLDTVVNDVIPYAAQGADVFFRRAHHGYGGYVVGGVHDAAETGAARRPPAVGYLRRPDTPRSS